MAMNRNSKLVNEMSFANTQKAQRDKYMRNMKAKKFIKEPTFTFEGLVTSIQQTIFAFLQVVSVNFGDAVPKIMQDASHGNNLWRKSGDTVPKISS